MNRRFVSAMIIACVLVWAGITVCHLTKQAQGQDKYPRIYFNGISVPVLLPESIPKYIADPGAVPSVYPMSEWVKLVWYGPYFFAVFNDRGVPKVIAIANYNFRPPKCWKHGVDKEGNFVLKAICEKRWLKILGEYHGEER